MFAEISYQLQYILYHNVAYFFRFLLQYNDTPVRLAAEKGRVALVELLVSRGADLYITNTVRNQYLK